MSSLKFEPDSAHFMGLIAVPRLAPSAMHWRYCDFSILGFGKVSLNLFSKCSSYLSSELMHGSSRPIVRISWSPPPLYFVHPSSSFDTWLCRLSSRSRYSTSGTVDCRPRRRPQLWAAIRHSRLDCHPSDGCCSCGGTWDVNPDSYSGRTVDMLSTKCELNNCLTLKNVEISLFVALFRRLIPCVCICICFHIIIMPSGVSVWDQLKIRRFVFLVNTDR